MPITPVGGGIVYLESTQKLIILMRTVIFILALTALAAPAMGAPKGPIACATPLVTATQNCNLCIEGASGATPLEQCYDCKAGYYLTAGDDVTGSCTRCGPGKGIAAGGSTTTTTTRPTAKVAGDCTACHISCSECFAPASASSCARCALDTFAATPATGGSTCGGSCLAGKTRPAPNADLTAATPPESAAVCTSNCEATCATCRGTTAASCTRCAIGKFASAYDATLATGTCGSTCDPGTTREVAAAAITAIEVKATVCVNCNSVCSECKGTAATGCTKCSAFNYATAWDATSSTATCGPCPDGKSRATGSAATLSGTEATSVCADNCHSSCASCKGTTDTSCTRCAAGRYASDWVAGSATAKCSSECDAGKTRDVAAAVLAGNEDKATICVNCNIACAECKGTAGTVCTKCAAGHFLSARTGTEVVGTCTACGDGKGKDADAAIFTGTSATTTKEDGCKATCTAASNCGVCSAAKPDECLTCPTGKTLDAATKKCPATASTGGSSASLVQALCGASLAAYALF